MLITPLWNSSAVIAGNMTLELRSPRVVSNNSLNSINFGLTVQILHSLALLGGFLKDIAIEELKS